MGNTGGIITPAGALVRCAIYTRKSTEEGLEQEFNSLDAQRQAAEAYIRSQCHQGWRLLPQRYDDPGFSGGDLERPAMAQLLADIEAGRIDCVVVYKVDRLSRSLLDFARIMAAFDERQVSFVSVTQQFNTSTSLGRLTLNILFSFAQFEREIIGERTRDKMLAARKQGKWVGGTPLLGYQVARGGGRLVIQAKEAKQVQEMFAVYAELGSLTETLEEGRRRGWKTKEWKSRRGARHAARCFTRGPLARLLGNVTYVGEVAHRGSIYAGEHAAIVDRELFERVAGMLAANARQEETASRNRQQALLAGLLRCGACESPMGYSYRVKNGRRCGYYVCSRAQSSGWRNCPSKSLGAWAVEQCIVDLVGRRAAEWLADGGERQEESMALVRGALGALQSNGGEGSRPTALRTLLEVATYDGRTGQLSCALRFESGTVECRIEKGKGKRGLEVAAAMPEAEAEATSAGPPRIAQLMALAIHFEGLLKEGVVMDYSDLARLGYVSPARITQIMNLLHLSPQLQERLLFEPRESSLGERWLRHIATEWRWDEQQRTFDAVVARTQR
jgi:DNA invertase Pin-like site-specific DNA recombinase